jgi:hypothetical protein
MQDLGYELPRIYIPRTPVNRATRRGESYWASPLPALLFHFLIEESVIDLPCPALAHTLHCYWLLQLRFLRAFDEQPNKRQEHQKL